MRDYRFLSVACDIVFNQGQEILIVTAVSMAFPSHNRPFPSYSLPSISKRVYVRNHSNENEFDLHENGPVDETHFHVNGFAPRLVLNRGKK